MTTMNRLARVALCALVLGALPTSAAVAHSGKVSIRVEGSSRTLVPLKAVTTVEDSVIKDGTAAHACSGFTPVGVLEQATGGRWVGTWDERTEGYRIASILGEAHSGTSNWAFWVNDRYPSRSLCNFEVETGDSVLIFPDTCAPDPLTLACAGPQTYPLGLAAPAVVKRGRTLSVTVLRYDEGGAAAPVADAQVKAGTATARTDSAGIARFRMRRAGTFRVAASKAGFVRSARLSVRVRAPKPKRRATR